jgi:hypothetical protein
MNSKRWKSWGVALAATLFALGAYAPGAQAEGPLHGRISHDEGGLMVKGASGSDWSHATTNAIVLPGDTLWIDETGVAKWNCRRAASCAWPIRARSKWYP